jgi:hypothetical protein
MIWKDNIKIYLVRFQVFNATLIKLTAFWDITPYDIALMMDAVQTSETSVYF